MSEKLGISHVAMGDILRQILRESDPLADKVRPYIQKGELVPDNLVIEIIKRRLNSLEVKDGFILDGFPRTIKQAEILDNYLGKERAIGKVINFVTPDDVIISRLAGRRVCRKCGANYHIKNLPPKKEGICDRCQGELYIREDDREETVKKRLKVYNENTYPLIEYYRDKGILIDFPGDLPLEEAQVKLFAMLNEIKKGS